MATNTDSQYPDLFELLEQHQDSIDLGSLINSDDGSGSSNSGGGNFLDSFHRQHSASSPSYASSSSYSQASPPDMNSEASNVEYGANSTNGSVASPASVSSADAAASPEAAHHAASPQEMIQLQQSEEQNDPEKDSDADILKEYSKRYQEVPEDPDVLSGRGSEDGNLCHVCGAPAGKHTYYGGKACPGK